MHTREHGNAYKQGENTGMYLRECHSLHLIFANTLRGKGNGDKGNKGVHFTSGILRRHFWVPYELTQLSKVDKIIQLE